jgi:hypothetical protein
MIQLIPLSPNFHQLKLNGHDIWFSYQTPIAFRRQDENKLYLHSNIWSKTTAKHINQVKLQHEKDMREKDWYSREIAYTTEVFEQFFDGISME